MGRRNSRSALRRVAHWVYELTEDVVVLVMPDSDMSRRLVAS